jgi:hypothetical protein
MTAFTMTGQAATFADIGDLAFGEGTVAPIVDPGGIEMIGNDLIVAKFEQPIDP